VFQLRKESAARDRPTNVELTFFAQGQLPNPPPIPALARRSGRIPALPYPPSSFASIILFRLRYKEMFAEMAIDEL
jgi:hypothetical protein